MAKYYKVLSTGKAPANLSIGDYVVTGGGTYAIKGVDTSGGYSSELYDKTLTTSNAASRGITMLTGDPQVTIGDYEETPSSFSSDKSSSGSKSSKSYDYEDPYAKDVAKTYKDVLDYDTDYSYEPYDSQYSGLAKDKLSEILNRDDFSYNAQEDPNYSAYRKQYLREGDRATSNALGQATAASGGQLNSAAMTAATQAGDYYATQLADKMPELYQQAYERYLKEYEQDANDLGMINNQDNIGYNRYLDDRNLDYSAWQTGFDMTTGQYNAALGMSNNDYGRYLDQYDMDRTAEQTAYERQLAAEQTAYAQQQDAIATALSKWQMYGYATQDVADTLGVKAGATTADQAYNQWYMKYQESQAAAKAKTGGSGSGSGGTGAASSASSDGDLESAIEAFNNGDFSDRVIQTLLNSGRFTMEELVAAGYSGSTGSSGSSGTTGGYRDMWEVRAASEAQSGAKTSGTLSANGKAVLNTVTNTQYRLTSTEKLNLVKKALEKGTITEAEANYILDYIG